MIIYPRRWNTKLRYDIRPLSDSEIIISIFFILSVLVTCTLAIYLGVKFPFLLFSSLGFVIISFFKIFLFIYFTLGTRDFNQKYWFYVISFCIIGVGDLVLIYYGGLAFGSSILLWFDQTFAAIFLLIGIMVYALYVLIETIPFALFFYPYIVTPTNHAFLCFPQSVYSC